MANKTEGVAQKFERIVLTIPKAKRLALSDDIKAVQEAVKSKKDLFSDQRIKGQKEEVKKYQVSWRNSGESVLCTLVAAARYAGVTKGSLAVYLSKNKGSYHFLRDDDIITIKTKA